jgi:hypothetical protein
MGNMRNVYKIFVGKQGYRLLWNTLRKWEGNIKMNISEKQIEIVGNGLV